MIKFFSLNNKSFQTDFYLLEMTLLINLSINVLPQVMKLHELKEKHKLNVFKRIKSAEIPKFQVLRILKAYSSHRKDVWST